MEANRVMDAQAQEDRSASPWLGQTQNPDAPVNELLAQADTAKISRLPPAEQEKAMEARWAAARKSGSRDDIEQAQNIGPGYIGAGGVKDLLGSAAKMAADTVGGVPQLTRTLAQAVQLPADVNRFGQHLAFKAMGVPPQDPPEAPGLSRIYGAALNEVADDIAPAFHDVAAGGGAMAESYMTPKFKQSISKEFLKGGATDPLWWENQAGNALLFMASDGLMTGGVTRSAYMNAYGRTMAEFAGQKVRQSIVEGAAVAAGQKAAMKAGMVTSAAFNGAVISGQTGQEVHDEIMGADESTLMKFDSYRQDRANGIPDNIARASLANDRSAIATYTAGISAGLSGAVLGNFVSHLAIGMNLGKGVASSIGKTTLEAAAGGVIQSVGGGAAARAGSAANFSDWTKEERANALDDAISGAATFAPLGLLGGFHATKPEVDKIKDNALGDNPKPGVKEAAENLAKADYALKRIQAALDDPRVQVDYNDLDRAQKARDAAMKDFVAAGETAGIIGEDKDGVSETKQLDRGEGSTGGAGEQAGERVPGQPAGQRSARREAQRDAAPGQQDEDVQLAAVQSQAGREPGQDGRQPGGGPDGADGELKPLPVEPLALDRADKLRLTAKAPEPKIPLKPLPVEPLALDRDLKPRLKAGQIPKAEPPRTVPVPGKPHITLKPAPDGGFLPPPVTTPDARANLADIPPPNRPLTTKEQAAQERMKRIVAHVDAAEAEYAKLDGTDGGNIINTDIARELSPDYSNSLQSRSTMSNAVQEPSSWLADKLYERRLARPVREGKEASVMFTAGGSDAGKSVSLGSEEAQRADIIYDGNMNNLPKARKRIAAALKSGRNVNIQFTYRDPIDAFKNGVLPRAMKFGRAVPVEAHADTHNGSFKTVMALARQYADDDRVTFRSVDVSAGRASSLDAIADKHYEVTPSQLHKIAAEEFKNGRITEAVFRGVSGKRAERLVGSGKDNGQLPAKPVAQAGTGDHTPGQAGAGTEGHGAGSEGHPGGPQEKDQLGEGVSRQVQIERRIDSMRRQQVAEMSPGELRQALLTHELTGLPNRRAFDESERLPYQASIDVNSLKWHNDNGGHATGDAVLHAVAEALREEHDDEVIRVHHFGGDEFHMEGTTKEALEAAIQRVKDRLAHEIIRSGDWETQGVTIAHGVGKTFAEADSKLQPEKDRQEADGERAARGEQPPNTIPFEEEDRSPIQFSVDDEGKDAPLHGLPKTATIPGVGKVSVGPFHAARELAKRLAKAMGIDYRPVKDYVKVDVPRAQRIAEAYESMRNNPADPAVRASYDALKRETLRMWREIKASGLKVEFIRPGEPNPYEQSPRLAVEDVKNNNHLWAFPTESGFGEGEENADHPLLEPSGEIIDGKERVHNDIFRIVHDYFGHVMEGTGFRADGEENAWRIHSAMYSPEALPAMTTETRGQNSWVNYGPAGARNREAKQDNTVYAPQKAGLLPREFWTDRPDMQFRVDDDDTLTFRHFSKFDADSFTLDPRFFGTGRAGAERARVANGAPRTTALYGMDGHIEPEFRGMNEYTVTVPKSRIYDASADPQKLMENAADFTAFEHAAKEAGYIGYYMPGSHGFFRGQARLFRPAKAVRREGSSADRRANARRRDQGIMSKVEDIAGTAAERAVIRNGGIDSGVVRNVARHIERAFGFGVKVVEHPREIPGVGRWDAENLPIKGVFIDDENGGRVYLVRQNLGSERDALSTAYHEVVGHYGLRRLLDSIGSDKYAEVMDTIWKQFPDLVRDAAARNKIDLGKGVIARRSAAEEVVAYAAERRLMAGSKRTVWEKVVQLVRDALRSIGVKHPWLDWRTSDIDSLIDRSADFVRRGGTKTMRERDLLSSRITGKARQYASGEREKRWHSALTKAVDELPQSKASPEQWKGIIKNLTAKGVKAEEIELSGINDWLDKVASGYYNGDDFFKSVFNSKSVLKQALLNELRDREVKLGETNLRASKPAEINVNSKYYSGRLSAWIEDHGGLANPRLDVALINSPRMYDYFKEIHPDLFESNDPAESYTEWADRILADIGWRPREENTGEPVYDRDSLSFQPWDAEPYSYQERLLTVPDENVGEAWNDPHWRDQGNVIAHTRWDTRTYDGQKHLFLQEVQSDRHQEGRRLGYRNTKTIKENDRLYRAMSALQADARDAYRESQGKITGFDSLVNWLARPENSKMSAFKILKELTEFPDGETSLDERHALMLKPLEDYVEAVRAYTRHREQNPIKGSVPDSPFKQSWPTMVLKRMLQEAAEQGHDYLSWTSGDIQNERYDLSKLVDRVILHDEKTATGDGFKDTQRFIIVDKEGHRIADLRNAKDEDIESWVGADVAKKLKEQPPQNAASNLRELRGLNLRVGGEGMRGFYDKILVDAANKLVKRYGAKVERTSIRKNSTGGGVSGHDIMAEMHNHPDPAVREMLRTEDGQKEYWANLSPPERDDLIYQYRHGEGLFERKVDIHSIKITPELRAAAMERTSPLRAMFKVGDANEKARAIITPIARHLTDEEKAGLGRIAARKVLDIFKSLPPTKEFAAAALAGKAKRGWYRESAQAIANVFGPDAPRFSALLSALSPQVSVETNLQNAIRVFVNWDKAGRPQTRGAIFKVMGDSVLGSNHGKSVLPAWIPNTVRALTHPEPEKVIISGPKVNSFMRNLQGHVNEVTLDAWMANFARVDQKGMFGGGITKTGPGKRPGYLGYSAKIRAAAEMLSKLTGETWTPAEVQETVWSWAKTAYETADSYHGMATIPELVKDKELTDELIRSTPDFKTLFTNPGYESILRKAGYGRAVDQLREQPQAEPRAASEASKAAEDRLQPALLKAARRLDDLRQERNQQAADTRRENAMLSVGGPHSPEMEAFLSKIAPDKRPWGERVKDLLKNLRDEVMQSVFDSSYGIERAWRMSGKEGPNLGRMSARLAKNHQSLMDAIVRHGAPIWKDDAPALTGHTGFQDIVAPLGTKVDLFFRAMVARRAERLMREGRENLFTPEEIAAGNSLWKENPEFEKAYAELAKFKKQILDFAQEAGIINPDTRATWENDDYVPFHRIMDANGTMSGSGAGGAFGRVKQQIRQLKGGTAALGDPMENMLRNWSSLVQASLRNKAMRLTVDGLADTGLLHRRGKDAAPGMANKENFKDNLRALGIDPDRLKGEQFERLYEQNSYIPESENAVWVYRNGVREHYEVEDPYLFRALANIHSNGRSAFYETVKSIAAIPKRIVTFGIVKSPVFIAKVLVRHSMLQFLTGHESEVKHLLPDFVPGLDTAKGIYKILANSEEARNLAAAGGTFVGAHSSGSVGNIARQVRIRQGMKTGGVILNTAHAIGSFYNHLLAASEGTHRLAVAKAVEKEGGSRVQQAFAARNVLDYSKGGDSAFINFFFDTVPFLKAGLSGASSAYELAARNPAGFALRGAVLALASAAYAYYHKDNERYKALTDDQKISYYHFFDVFEEGDHWQVPKGFDSAGIVSTVPEALTDWALSDEHDRMKQGVSLVMQTLAHQIGYDFMPQLIRPVVDVSMNRNSYSGAPILSTQDLNVAPEAQDAPYVSPTYRGLATHMPEWMPDWAQSPKELQYIGSAYFATIGQFVTAVTDRFAEAGQGHGERPTRGPIQDIPGVSQIRSIGPARRTRYSDEMFTYAKQVDTEYQTFNKLAKGGDVQRALKYRIDHRQDLAVREDLDDAVKRVTSLYKQARQVQQMPGLSGEEKQAQLDRIQTVINAIAQRAYQLRPGGKLNPFTASKLMGATRGSQVNTLRYNGLPATAALLQELAS